VNKIVDDDRVGETRDEMVFDAKDRRAVAGISSRTCGDGAENSADGRFPSR
jgi:hypothetical protein